MSAIIYTFFIFIRVAIITEDVKSSLKRMSKFFPFDNSHNVCMKMFRIVGMQQKVQWEMGGERHVR